jgi:nucleoporin NUP159
MLRTERSWRRYKQRYDCLLNSLNLANSYFLQALGFKSIAGDSKIRLLPTPWPAQHPPPSTSSLLSIASQKGLLAAAGPDALVIASTASVREGFSAQSQELIKTYQPQLTIPLQTRISQVAFSADENALMISSENGGGLAVYDVSGLERGNTQPAFEISTNGTALRELVPNPVKERADAFAMVTVNGQLLLGNLSSKQLLNGPNGPVLKDNVSCVSWSKQGKQLVAGLGDGKAFQMTPEGEGKAEIPVPPDLSGGAQRHGKLHIHIAYKLSNPR